MEKMPGGDLLNYILEKEPSRLTERDSKFIIFQVKLIANNLGLFLFLASNVCLFFLKVLIGLKKLHKNSIAHCKSHQNDY